MCDGSLMRIAIWVASGQCPADAELGSRIPGALQDREHVLLEPEASHEQALVLDREREPGAGSGAVFDIDHYRRVQPGQLPDQEREDQPHVRE